MNKKLVSLKRASELKGRIEDYLKVIDSIPKGYEEKVQKSYKEKKQNILKYYNATENDWNDYKWHLKNRIEDPEVLSLILSLSDAEKKDLIKIGSESRWAVSPYYAALMNSTNIYDPLRLMSIPLVNEIIDVQGDLDPMNEEYTNPAGAITRRYPDRLIINVTNICAMYCRHCQRKRNIDYIENNTSRDEIIESINYVKENKEIRDVLLTGGDALMLSDKYLEFIISELRKIPHVEIIRIGTRTPVTLPQRITDDLIDMLKKYHPIYLNTHFNHPKEVTPESKLACLKLADAGIVLGNQAVLLNGINNDKFVMRLLNQELLKIRVRPYYIFHNKHVKGISHFNTSIDDGLEIMEYLRGYTSGLGIPYYIVNAPGGLGKTPILPNYVVSRGKDYIVIRTWEGKVMEYDNKPTVPLKDIIKDNESITLFKDIANSKKI
ncbi:glutamate 2,3-aminomutase [Mycoplasmatota bacterium]|nr:glutamate 2,3-aminomutase [Mycoplasmatota bacterium]